MFAKRARLASGVVAFVASVMGGNATAQTVRLTGLSDVSFVLTSTSEAFRAQNVCAFATNPSGRYSVRASGSGTGGALTLQGSGAPLPYEVQWASTPNQTSGTMLPANQTVGVFTDGDVLETCFLAPNRSASLIVILRSAALSVAGAGNYTGTLTLILGAL